MFSTPETSVHVRDKNREISPLEREEGYGGKDLEKRYSGERVNASCVRSGFTRIHTPTERVVIDLRRYAGLNVISVMLR